MSQDVVKRQPNEKLKSKVMDEFYQSDIDFFGNRQHNRYKLTMINTVRKIIDLTSHYSFPMKWHDIGCGSGNLVEAVSNIAQENNTVFRMSGCDISETAAKFCRENLNLGENFNQCDLEKYEPTTFPLWRNANVISMIDVMYYLGEVRPWKTTFDKLWDSLIPGQLFVLGDCLVRHQYRDYPKLRGDIKIIDSYTEDSVPIDSEKRENGRTFNRYLKIRILQK